MDDVLQAKLAKLRNDHVEAEEIAGKIMNLEHRETWEELNRYEPSLAKRVFDAGRGLVLAEETSKLELLLGCCRGGELPSGRALTITD